jgi:hypothetical protein
MIEMIFLLITLSDTETLKHNRKAGIRIALAPLITDLPIILSHIISFPNYHSLI